MRTITFSLLNIIPLLALLLINSGARSETIDPVVFLYNVSSGLLNTLKKELNVIIARPGRLLELAETELVPHFALKTMSKLVLGKYWRRANQQQQEEFSEEFKNLVIRFYVSALISEPDRLDGILESKQQLIQFKPVKNINEKKITVKSTVNLPSGQQIPVNFRLYHYEDGSWRIFDVNIEGISLITNYRNTFGSEISRDGMNKMIQRLKENNQKLLKKFNEGEELTAINSSTAD